MVNSYDCWSTVTCTDGDWNTTYTGSGDTYEHYCNPTPTTPSPTKTCAIAVNESNYTCANMTVQSSNNFVCTAGYYDGYHSGNTLNVNSFTCWSVIHCMGASWTQVYTGSGDTYEYYCNNTGTYVTNSLVFLILISYFILYIIDQLLHHHLFRQHQYLSQQQLHLHHRKMNLLFLKQISKKLISNVYF